MNATVISKSAKSPKCGKINIWNWIDKRCIRPVFSGVFYDDENETAVATDGKVMLLSKDLYVRQEDSEDCLKSREWNGERGCIMDKKGNYILQKFPNYHFVIPQSGLEEFTVDFERVKAYVKLDNAAKKVKGKRVLFMRVGAEKGSDTFLDIEKCRLLLTLPKGTFYTNGRNEFGMIKFVSDDKRTTALFMRLHVYDPWISADVHYDE